MTFRVGQDVVCIKEGWNHPGTHPVLNRTYKIAEIEAPVRAGGADAYLRFNNCDHGYDRRHFRPAVEKKAEISFTANAPKDSEKWDNRAHRKQKERALERYFGGA